MKENKPVNRTFRGLISSFITHVDLAVKFKLSGVIHRRYGTTKTFPCSNCQYYRQSGGFQWSRAIGGVQMASAEAHLIGPDAERIPLLDWTYWRNLGGDEEWKRRLEMMEDVRDVQRLRRATYAGSPLGSEGFVAEIEERLGSQWRKPSRPMKKDVGRVEKRTERPASVLAG